MKKIIVTAYEPVFVGIDTAEQEALVEIFYENYELQTLGFLSGPECFLNTVDMWGARGHLIEDPEGLIPRALSLV